MMVKLSSMIPLYKSRKVLLKKKGLALKEKTKALKDKPLKIAHRDKINLKEEDQRSHSKR